MNRTQEMIKRLFLSIAISVAALIAGTSSAAAAVTRCDGPLSGTHDTVLVPKGKNCEVVDTVTVEGNVILQEGASLIVQGSGFTVNGNLQGDGVGFVSFDGQAVFTIHGNVSITGATGTAIRSEVRLQSVSIGGNLNISDSNVIAILMLNTMVAGNALFHNNTTSPLPGLFTFQLSSNTIVGNLVCNGNNPAPDLSDNTVGGQTIGQCKLP